IRLDVLGTFFLDVGMSDEKESAELREDRSAGRYQLVHNNWVLGSMAVRARKAVVPYESMSRQGARELHGLVTLLGLYAWRSSAVRIGAIVKKLTPVMARTDFAKIFSMLSPPVRDHLAAHPKEWVQLVLGVAEMPARAA